MIHVDTLIEIDLIADNCADLFKLMVEPVVPAAGYVAVDRAQNRPILRGLIVKDSSAVRLDFFAAGFGYPIPEFQLLNLGLKESLHLDWNERGEKTQQTDPDLNHRYLGEHVAAEYFQQFDCLG